MGIGSLSAAYLNLTEFITPQMIFGHLVSWSLNEEYKKMNTLILGFGLLMSFALAIYIISLATRLVKAVERIVDHFD